MNIHFYVELLQKITSCSFILQDNPADPLSRLHGTLVRSAAICAAINLSQGSILSRIIEAYSTDSSFSDHDKLLAKGCLFQNDLWTNATGQILVPSSMRQEIMSAHHDDKWAGHFGVDKTLDLIRRYFTWKGITSDVTSFVAECPRCQVNKNANQAPAGLLQPLPIPESR